MFSLISKMNNATYVRNDGEPDQIVCSEDLIGEDCFCSEREICKGHGKKNCLEQKYEIPKEKVNYLRP